LYYSAPLHIDAKYRVAVFGIVEYEGMYMNFYRVAVLGIVEYEGMYMNFYRVAVTVLYF